MGKHIDLRVLFRGQERLLRLIDADGDWHAKLMVPGQQDLVTLECPVPSPPGTTLPGMWLKDSTLFIEPPSDNVVSSEMGRLLASGRISNKGGWIAVEVDSIMAPHHDIGDLTLAELKSMGLHPTARDIGNDLER